VKVCVGESCNVAVRRGDSVWFFSVDLECDGVRLSVGVTLMLTDEDTLGVGEFLRGVNVRRNVTERETIDIVTVAAEEDDTVREMNAVFV
jgi:hypothetical protein